MLETWQMVALHVGTSQLLSSWAQDNPPILYPLGAHGEIRVFAEDGKPGEDMEETLVCSEKWTNHVLQVSGE